MKLGFIVLAHQDMHRVKQLVRHLSTESSAVAVHIDRHAASAEFTALQDALADCRNVVFSRRIHCEWGRFSLVQATLDAAQALLDAAPDLDHIMLISGSCLPIRPIRQLRRYLGRNKKTDFIESVSVENNFWVKDGLNEERFTLYFPFSWRKQRRLFDRFVNLQRWLGVRRKVPEGLVPHIGSQWWCLTARTLRAILTDPRRPYHDAYFRRAWIPDESYFQTLARAHAQRIESRSLTFSKFDYLGRPFVFYDDHLKELTKSDCFMARKIWVGANGLYETLLDHKRANQPMSKADPATFDAMFEEADRLRCEGGEGRFNQGRFPYDRADRTGVSATPFTVFVGFKDLYNHFPIWVQKTTGQVAYGSLFARGHVGNRDTDQHFAGNLPAEPKVRNRNAKGYLANLLWQNRDKHQSFLFDFRDHAGILKTLAHDTKATVVLVRHAWLLTLLNRQASFENTLSNARRYHRLEQNFLQEFARPKARAHLVTLPLEFAVNEPAAALAVALSQIEGHTQTLKTMPERENVDGLDQLVRKLRNRGLKLDYDPAPRKKGDPLPDYQAPYIVK